MKAAWKPSWIVTVFLSSLAALAGWEFQYLSSLDQQRQALLRTSRRDAYVAFLDAQALAQDQGEYRTKTEAARKKIAIYGDRAVATALANYWRGYFKEDLHICAGPPEKGRADVAIYRNMRRDIMPSGEEISDDDMMLLVNWCRLP